MRHLYDVQAIAAHHDRWMNGSSERPSHFQKPQPCSSTWPNACSARRNGPPSQPKPAYQAGFFCPPTSHVGAKAADLQIPTPSSRRAASHARPGLVFFVIPSLSRDPQRTADLCKGRQTTLDPGSSPGMTNTTNWMTDQICT